MRFGKVIRDTKRDATTTLKWIISRQHYGRSVAWWPDYDLLLSTLHKRALKSLEDAAIFQPFLKSLVTYMTLNFAVESNFHEN